MEIYIGKKRCRSNNQSTHKKLEEFIKNNPISEDSNEYDVRMMLLPFVENILKSNEQILYDGNSIWDVKRLIRHFKIFVKFYDYNHFPEYLYKFFHLQCGSIAHYNKAGWLETYPDLSALKNFFKSNEYSRPIKSYPPSCHYDAWKAVKIMDVILFKV